MKVVQAIEVSGVKMISYCLKNYVNKLDFKIESVLSVGSDDMDNVCYMILFSYSSDDV